MLSTEGSLPSQDRHEGDPYDDQPAQPESAAEQVRGQGCFELDTGGAQFDQFLGAKIGTALDQGPPFREEGNRIVEP